MQPLQVHVAVPVQWGKHVHVAAASAAAVLKKKEG